MQKNDGQSPLALYVRLLKYALRYWFVFVLGILGLVIFSATNTGFLATIKLVTDKGFVEQDSQMVHLLPILLFGLIAIRAFFGFFSNFAMRWVGSRIVEDLRYETFNKILRLPISFYDAHSAGIITSKLTYNTEQMANAATTAVISLVEDSLTVIGMVGYMFYLDWRLTLLFVVVIPFMAIYLKKMIPQIRQAGSVVQVSMGEMTKISEEACQGQRIVKIFGGVDYEIERFSQAASKNRRMNLRLSRISGINSMVIEMLAAVSLGFVVYYAIGKFTAGDFAAFIGALLMVIPPIKSLTKVNETLQVAVSGARGVFEMMDKKSETDTGQLAIKKSKGQITFDEVYMRYDGSVSNALEGVSFIIRPGEKIALVGRSGGGKTSLVNLLPRFYDDYQGTISLDGHDIRQIRLDELRNQFALVSQEVVLFNDTVFNNIAYGTLRERTLDEVIAAAKAAHAWEFIQSLSHGLDTVIGDRGVRLSGGQRQRLAIARAILKDAPILILDEATSALDNESESHVQQAFDYLMKNRTSIVIAHRLSTIENSDRILVMDRGRIVENGTHKQLMAKEGYYAKLYKKQFDV
jgi:ATP-binding cassette, subfamily B, bacterial MsbA